MKMNEELKQREDQIWLSIKKLFEDFNRDEYEQLVQKLIHNDRLVYTRYENIFLAVKQLKCPDSQWKKYITEYLSQIPQQIIKNYIQQPKLFNYIYNIQNNQSMNITTTLKSYNRPLIQIASIQMGGIIINYNVYINHFIIPINLININKDACDEKSFDHGAFGCVRIQKFEQCEFVVKRIYFRQKSRIMTYKRQLQNIINQISIYKLGSAHRIAPALYQNIGFDLICYNNCIQFNMEKCQIIDYNNLTKKQYQKIQFDVKECLFKFHMLKLIHKDIKPQNILYSNKYKKYVLSDFGLSTIISQNINKISFTYFQGTPHFCNDQMKSLEQQDHGDFINLYKNDMDSLLISLSKIEPEDKQEQILIYSDSIHNEIPEQKNIQIRDQKISYNYFKALYQFKCAKGILKQQQNLVKQLNSQEKARFKVIYDKYKMDYKVTNHIFQFDKQISFDFDQELRNKIINHLKISEDYQQLIKVLEQYKNPDYQMIINYMKAKVFIKFLKKYCENRYYTHINQYQYQTQHLRTIIKKLQVQSKTQNTQKIFKTRMNLLKMVDKYQKNEILQQLIANSEDLNNQNQQQLCLQILLYLLERKIISYDQFVQEIESNFNQKIEYQNSIKFHNILLNLNQKLSPNVIKIYFQRINQQSSIKFMNANHINLHYMIAKIYKSQNDYPKSLQYVNKLINSIIELKDKTYQAYLIQPVRLKTQLLYQLCLFKEAFYNSLQSFELLRQYYGFTKFILLDDVILMGMILLRQKKFKQAFIALKYGYSLSKLFLNDYDMRNIKLLDLKILIYKSKKEKNHKKIINLMNFKIKILQFNCCDLKMISLIYQQIYQYCLANQLYVQAQISLQKQLQLYNLQTNIQQIMYNLFKQSHLYKIQNLYLEALQIQFKILGIKRQTNPTNYESIIETLLYIIQLYFRLQNFRQLKKYTQQCLIIISKLTIIRSQYNQIFGYLEYIYNTQRNFKKGLKLSFKNLQIALNNGQINSLQVLMNYERIIKSLQQTKNYYQKQVYEYIYLQWAQNHNHNIKLKYKSDIEKSKYQIQSCVVNNQKQRKQLLKKLLVQKSIISKLSNKLKVKQLQQYYNNIRLIYSKLGYNQYPKLNQ